MMEQPKIMARALAYAASAALLASPAVLSAEAGKSVKTSIIIPFEKSGAKNTEVEVIELEPGARISTQSIPEERLFYVLNGRGMMSLYGSLADGDDYVIRQDMALYMTPGVKHEILNNGDSPLRLALFRVRGGLEPKNPIVWPVIAGRVAGMAQPEIGAGIAVTYIYDESSNPSLQEGQNLRIRGIKTRRPQRLATVELLQLAPGGSTRPHTHNDTDETYYVLFGEGTFTEDGKSFPVKAGSSVSFRPGTLRQTSNTGTYPLIYISMNTIAAPPEAK